MTEWFVVSETFSLWSLFLSAFLSSTLLPGSSEALLVAYLSQGFEPTSLLTVATVGNTIGGLSSLVYLQHQEKDLCGVVVLAPFLADDRLIEEVKKYGGIEKWAPEVEEIKNSIDDQINSLWVWLTSKNDFSNIYLGYGKQDRLIAGSHLLETFLEQSHVIRVNGKHDWVTGRKIWQEQLKSRKETGLLGNCN